MKFKKAFAWILAVAMVITLMPSMAFASTTNSVSSTPTVSADGKIPSSTVLTLRVDDIGGWDVGSTQNFKLTLENGTWDKEPNKATGTNTIQNDNDTSTLSDDSDVLIVGVGGITGSKTTTISAIEFISGSENTLEFGFTISNDKLDKDEYVTLTIPGNIIKAGSDAGPLNIVIDGMDSQIRSGTLTIANVGTNNTTATVNGSVKTFPRSSIDKDTIGTSIEIRETAINSLKESSWQSLRLSLPKGVSFDNTWANWEISGNLTTANTIGGVGSGAAVIAVRDSDNDRIVDLSFQVAPSSNGIRNVLVIKPAFTISRDAAEGDIAVQLTGGTNKNYTGDDDNKISDASDLIVAKYGNESVEVSTVEDIPTFISGYTQDTKSKSFTFKVTLKENMKGSLDGDRYVDFELPDEVQICDQIKAKIGSGSNNPVFNSFIEVGDNTNNTISLNKNMSSFAFKVPNATGLVSSGSTWNKDKANTITFEVPVTVQADFTGDITCKVSGAKAGVEETELVVAKAESPITVTANTTEVRNGVQTQAVADITITENYPGYLDDTNGTNDVLLRMYTLGLGTNEMVFENYDSITVTDGDLELGKHSKSGGRLTIPIKSSSTKASTIEIKGAVVALNRTLPEGPYALQVYGSALVQNGRYNDGDFADPSGVPESASGANDAVAAGDVCAAKIADYVKIVTPADPSTITNKINAVFTLRQDTFTNNGETVQMDTAPYLDANNRTQLPIRYAAIACGVPESDISWNQATQTATINGQNVVLRITIGSNIMQTSAGNVTMDTAAVSSNGRIFVPIRYIANALGADVAWDQDAKTITLTN